jgi:hypothetical protein
MIYWVVGAVWRRSMSLCHLVELQYVFISPGMELMLGVPGTPDEICLRWSFLKRPMAVVSVNHNFHNVMSNSYLLSGFSKWLKLQHSVWLTPWVIKVALLYNCLLLDCPFALSW